MSTKIIDRDHGYRGLFTRALARSNQHQVVTVGIQGDAASKEHVGNIDIDNVRLAGVHEFGAEIKTSTGTIKIPERSFIRATVDKHGAYVNEIRSLAVKVLTGALTATNALKILGEKVSSDMKSRIENGIPPPNAPSTIAAKGSSKPLIDTGQMKNSISYDVHEDVAGEPAVTGNK